MSIARIIAVVVIYLIACGGWAILGTATALRSHQFDDRLEGEVVELWGSRLVQRAPSITAMDAIDPKMTRMMLAGSRIDVGIDLEHRQRGLIWYPTYACDFAGSYRIANPDTRPRRVALDFDFPAAGGTYERFALDLDGAPLVLPIDTEQGLHLELDLAPGQERVFGIRYATRGLSSWRYVPSLDDAERVRDLTAMVRTDFTEVDYPDGTISPTATEATGDGMLLTWANDDLITRQDIGVIVPERLNPGPLSARITFFAPVCLIFFFLLLATICIVRQVDIHPMHYLFTAGGFFAFHLLFAYLVDHIDIHLSFAIAALSSVVLVSTYLKAALGERFPFIWSTVAQFFFLVLFSYSFFLTGTTGLTVAIGSVLTLAVLMRVTADIDWAAFFARGRTSQGLQERSQIDPV